MWIMLHNAILVPDNVQTLNFSVRSLLYLRYYRSLDMNLYVDHEVKS